MWKHERSTLSQEEGAHQNFFALGLDHAVIQRKVGPQQLREAPGQYLPSVLLGFRHFVKNLENGQQYEVADRPACNAFKDLHNHSLCDSQLAAVRRREVACTIHFKSLAGVGIWSLTNLMSLQLMNKSISKPLLCVKVLLRYSLRMSGSMKSLSFELGKNTQSKQYA